MGGAEEEGSRRGCDKAEEDEEVVGITPELSVWDSAVYMGHPLVGLYNSTGDDGCACGLISLTRAPQMYNHLFVINTICYMNSKCPFFAHINSPYT